jgi:diguanylate cyclase (GGDEF)-like protein
MIGKRLRLQTMFFIIFVIAALVPTMFLSVWIQKSALVYEMNTVRERHLLLARNLTVALSRYAVDIEAVFDDISSHIGNKQVDDHRHLMETIGISMLAKVDSSGAVTDFYHGKAEALPAEDLAQLLTSNMWRAFGRISLTGVLLSRSGVPSIYLLKRTGNGEAIIGNLRTDYIIAVQQAVTFGKKGHAAIVDHLGHILAHPKPEWQSEIKDISRLAPVQAMMAGKTGVIKFYSPAIRAEMIAGYTAVPSTGWGVMIPQPLAELEERAARVRLPAITVAGIGFFIALMLGWWLSRSITRPLEATVTAASLLATQHPDSRARMPDGLKIKEMETLCSSFNDMADQIDRARLQLEEKVHKRTLALRTEVIERRRLAEKFRYMATHDQLTGLPNRNLFMDRLHKALQHGERENHQTAVFFLDLDGFKAVNDDLGHVAGDALLVGVAERLRAIVRESDTVGRYGGDEFTVLLVSAGQESDIAAVAGKILSGLAKPFNISGDNAKVSASIGIALAENGEEPEALLHKADVAMYEAKANGKNCYQFFLTESV